MDWKLDMPVYKNSPNHQAWSTNWPTSHDVAPDFVSSCAGKPSDALIQRYWRALGVTDQDQIKALTRKVQARLVWRIQDIAPEELPERALRETRGIIDEWLAATLILEDRYDSLAATRAALLSGALTDWPAALLNSDAPSRNLTEQLNNALIEPTPPPAPLSMPVQRIELRRSLWAFLLYHIPFRFGKRIFMQLRTLFGYHP